MALNTDTDQLREIQHKVIVKDLYERIEANTEKITKTADLFDTLALLRFKGSATPYELYLLLLNKDVKIGDVYNCRKYEDNDPRPAESEEQAVRAIEPGMNVVYIEDEFGHGTWDEFSYNVDLSPYATNDALRALAKTVDTNNTSASDALTRVNDKINNELIDIYPSDSKTRAISSWYASRIMPTDCGRMSMTISNAFGVISSNISDYWNTTVSGTSMATYRFDRDFDNSDYGYLTISGRTLPRGAGGVTPVPVLDLTNIQITVTSPNGNRTSRKARFIAETASIQTVAVGGFRKAVDLFTMQENGDQTDYNTAIRPIRYKLSNGKDIDLGEYNEGYDTSVYVDKIMLMIMDHKSEELKIAQAMFTITGKVRLF